MLQWVIAFLLNALVIFLVARLTPGVRIKNYGTAIVAAVICGVAAVALKVLLFPAIVLTFGLAILAINGFVLWLADKLLDGLEIKGFGPLAVMTIGTSIGSVLVSWIVYR